MNIRISITGTATILSDANDWPSDKLREQAIDALNGAEIHTDLDGISFRIEVEHDPHGAD